MPAVTAKPSFAFAKKFKEWAALKVQTTMETKRMTLLRDDLRDSIKQYGEEVDGGHWLYTFGTPVEVKDGASVTVYDGIMAQRRLVPAAPTPDPDQAEALLRKKNLWMTDEQEKHLEALRISCPNVTIYVEPDEDAVAALYLKGKISEKEYESILVEQKEQWAFVPQELK